MAIDDINKEKNIEENEGSNWVGNIKDGASADVSKNLQLVSKIYAELGAEFSYPQTINKESRGEYTRISVVNPEVENRSEPEIVITLQPNGNVFFKINPYDHYEEFYFISKEITPEQLSGEIKRAKDVLKTGEAPQNGLLRKVEYPNPETFKEEDYVTDEQLHTGYTHYYNELLAKQWEDTANKFYEEHAKYITK